jgi:hypothetical protein
VKSAIRLFISILGVALVAATGWRIWAQQQEIAVLRSQALTVAHELVDLREQRRELETRLHRAAQVTNAPPEKPANVPVSSPEPATPAGVNLTAKEAAAIVAGVPTEVNEGVVKQWVANAYDPDVLRRLNLQAQNKTLQRYGALFAQLDLAPEQTQQLTKLLTDKRQIATDVAVASFQQGEDPTRDPNGFQERLATTREGIEAEIKALLGEAHYAQYQDYDRSVSQLNALNNLELALRSRGEPMSSEQLAQMKAVLQDSDSTRINAKLIKNSQAFLSAGQIQTLQDLRAVQQANSQRRNQPLQVLPTTPVERSDTDDENR